MQCRPTPSDLDCFSVAGEGYDCVLAGAVCLILRRDKEPADYERIAPAPGLRTASGFSHTIRGRAIWRDRGDAPTARREWRLSVTTARISTAAGRVRALRHFWRRTYTGGLRSQRHGLRSPRRSSHRLVVGQEDLRRAWYARRPPRALRGGQTAASARGVAASLDFDIDRRHLPQCKVVAGIAGIPGNGRREITRIFTDGGAQRGFAMLDARVAENYFAEILAMKGIAQTRTSSRGRVFANHAS